MSKNSNIKENKKLSDKKSEIKSEVSSDQKVSADKAALKKSDGQKKKEKSEKANEPKTLIKKKKSKIKHQIIKGQAHIQCTYNNTMITVSDLNGAVLGWSSAGLLGFKGAKKSTPYAATQVAKDVTEKVRKFGVQDLEIFIKGVGSGRESAIRSLANAGFTLLSIRDMTPMPHNGCRPRKPRRV